MQRKAKYAQLAHACMTYPIIDNHTHNLLKASQRSTFPFEGLTTEAAGPAQVDTVHTVAHMRASRQLARLYTCPSDWDSVKRARDAMDYDDLCRRCFDGMNIQALLLDEGLGGIDEYCERAPWHEKLTTGGVAKIIIRVEVVAQEILKIIAKAEFPQESLADLFFTRLELELKAYGARPDIVGFKSVACYRTGLDVLPEPSSDQVIHEAVLGFVNTFNESGSLRIAHKEFNDTIVRLTLRIAAECDKPVQFHTGLGDNDIRLTKANPALMQPLIEAFPDTKIVLLHSSYPFTEEAGYLTAVYKNVYLDYGEIFPMVSGDGQRSAVRRMLDLCPTNKILFSTDGHWWPETYYLGVLQGRQAMLDVLSDYIDRDELSEDEAVQIVERAFFHNANKLYDLNLQPVLAAPST
ncbi:hypothetical protein EXIGLDRAFT_751177 [Exidia glandulosa HHB12029]|uniref:Amidohydrolase-related domain-containing protein n=1 Tax=Exidia glandulosa HHB12029 TaxID=1314781 RepID=A0A165FRR7_EXIGL|nr:hypothetical protein EXIGLDRAFT_751177 [Exidia glandulosa HHB12029]